MSELFFPVFNIVFGAIVTLTGYEVIWPFTNMSSEAKKKRKNFFKLLGPGLILWGLVNLIFF